MEVTYQSIKVPRELAELYAMTDRERFPCYNYSQFADERPDSLYYADFKVAERFGEEAIRDTFARCGDLTILNYKMLTELTLVLNQLLWEAWERGNENGDIHLARVYDELWREVMEAGHQRPHNEQTYMFSILD